MNAEKKIIALEHALTAKTMELASADGALKGVENYCKYLENRVKELEAEIKELKADIKEILRSEPIGSMQLRLL